MVTYVTDTVSGAALEPLVWIEGLALASTEYTDAWVADTSLSSLTTSSGTTTSSRAGTYGTIEG